MLSDPPSYMGAGDLNSGTHVCTAHTLLTKPSPLPTLYFLTTTPFTSTYVSGKGWIQSQNRIPETSFLKKKIVVDSGPSIAGIVANGILSLIYRACGYTALAQTNIDK